jgi:hypothetical protein
MPGFVKLDQGILFSSIWSEDVETRLVWITLLCMADSRGHVNSAVPGISKMAGIELEKVVKAIDILQGADKWSKNKDGEGRRIEWVGDGFNILNYENYRKKDYTAAARQRRHREKVKGAEAVEPLAPAANVEKDEKEKHSRVFTPPNALEIQAYFIECIKGRGLDGRLNSLAEADKFKNFYESKGWFVGKNKMKDWKAAARNWISHAMEKPPARRRAAGGRIGDEAGSRQEPLTIDEKIKIAVDFVCMVDEHLAVDGNLLDANMEKRYEKAKAVLAHYRETGEWQE